MTSSGNPTRSDQIRPFMKKPFATTRRDFLAFPASPGLPSVSRPLSPPVLGADAPSKKINILQIGCGRIGRDMDMPGLLHQTSARIVAVCDLDSLRLRTPRRCRGPLPEAAGFPPGRHLWRLSRSAPAPGYRRRRRQHAGLLARRTRHRRRPRGQRYLCPETAFHDHRRRTRGERHRPRKTGSSRSAASSAPARSSASPANWCAAGGLASCTRSKSACPVTPFGGSRQECPCRRT